ncbi:MAG: hypothetical protein NVS3B26_20500 [Mycobacteriales bacterium]
MLAFGNGQASLLTPESYAAMQTEQVVLDDPWILGRAWGLGWILPVPGIIGHDGATFGQYAFYRRHPETGAALCLLTNGPGARAVFEALGGVPHPADGRPAATVARARRGPAGDRARAVRRRLHPSGGPDRGPCC